MLAPHPADKGCVAVCIEIEAILVVLETDLISDDMKLWWVLGKIRGSFLGGHLSRRSRLRKLSPLAIASITAEN